MGNHSRFRYVAACLAVFHPVGLAAQDDQPRVDVSRWIAQLGPPNTTAAAELALERAGDRAVPSLIACLQEAHVDIPDQRRAAAALAVLGRMGPDAVPAYDAIVELTHDKTLCVEALRARADLAPYVGAVPPQIHRFAELVDPELIGRAMVQTERLLARGEVSADASLDELIEAVQKNQLFTRAAAAEILGRRGAGGAAVFDVLHTVLAQREKRPEGWDSFQHNGFVEPLEDQFRWRAGAALIALAPHAPRCVVAYGAVAVNSPHPRERAAALRALAAFGPDAEVALPDLIQIVCDDPGNRTAALETIGMLGPAGAPAIDVAIDASGADDERVRRVAVGLVAQLRAMGASPSESRPDAASAEIAGWIGKLSDPGERDAVTAALCANGEAAVDALTEVLRERSAPVEPVVLVVATAGAGLDAQRRRQLATQVLMASGHVWTGSRSSFSMGVDPPTEAQVRAHAMLVVGLGTELSALAQLLDNENAVVRLRAAEVLRQRLAAGADEGVEQAREALLTAVREEPPKLSCLRIGRSMRLTQPFVLGERIRAEAAAALLLDAGDPLDSMTGKDAQAVIAAAMRHQDPAVVSAAKKAREHADKPDPPRLNEPQAHGHSENKW